MVAVRDSQAAASLESLSFAGVESKRPFCQPVTGRQLADTFGAPRSGGRKHEGIDIFAPEGTPIHAITSGTVVQGFSNGLGGNVVRIQGDDGRFYYYAHLKGGTSSHLKVGEHVNAGQVIGGVGHTGDAAGTPNHLHLQVREGGEWVNPFKFIKPLPDLPDAMAGATATFDGGPVDPFDIDPGSPPSVADADSDGLIDQFETLFGTDPKLADTDHDALSDAYETSVAHTDPLSADTDKDGLTDSFEVAQQSDPGRAEIPEAVRAAHFGGLASLDSDADGLSDAFEDRAGTDPLRADTDRDGLSDGDEVAARSDPRSMDTDKDGLTDAFEAQQGTLSDGTQPEATSNALGGNALGGDQLGGNQLGGGQFGGGPLENDQLVSDQLGDAHDDYDVDGAH
ncbi:MAG TPA: peptidoglycan DD-metalloendopeptidase family protein [Kineosporiaceae bacterium]|nr:peptidoglycan DD-metalloendopeptidase family protein [Kineosporiaceae bacterium]